jgi:hypothetical protein
MIEYLDLGIAGILAIALFFFLRHLVAQMRQDRVFMEDRLTKIIDNYREDSKANAETTVKFAGILAELHTWLKARNGKSKE